MLNIYNKSNTECGIIRPTNALTWDHIHYLEVSYQYPVKGTMLIFKLCGGHLGFCRMPRINSVRGLSGNKVIFDFADTLNCHMISIGGFVRSCIKLNIIINMTTRSL